MQLLHAAVRVLLDEAARLLPVELLLARYQVAAQATLAENVLPAVVRRPSTRRHGRLQRL